MVHTKIKINRDVRLGSGTFAVVYAGTYLGTDVAIKSFNNNDSSSHKAFVTELEILFAL
jgi:hypothetical protein